MEKLTILNPFVVGRYISPDYFCDREQETAFLIKQIENGRNVALISPRRMGKTGLIHHTFHQEELTRFFQVIASPRMGFKWDAMSGEPSFDISLGDIQTPQTTLDEIFVYLEAADMPCVVAIDEFQQISNYEEKNVEAMLRTKIQQCKQTQFIFAGSKRHLMSNMFNFSSKPFYQSAISMGLNPIPLETYTTFATRLFEERGKHVSLELIQQVYQQFNGCTWFVQMLMNELFSLTAHDELCDTDKLEVAIQNVILTQEGSYQDLMSHLAPKQKLILQAIAREGNAKAVTSSVFIKKYSLPSASSVQSAIKGLLKNDIITQEEDCYRVYDYFFATWLAKDY